MQINYAIQLIKPIIARKARSFTVRDGPTDAYNAQLQKRIGGSVFTACASYYRSSASGKNVAIFPGPLAQFWWWLLSPRWADYQAVGAEKWERERRRARVLNIVAALLVVAGVAGLTRPHVRAVLGTLLKNVMSRVSWRFCYGVVIGIYDLLSLLVADLPDAGFPAKLNAYFLLPPANYSIYLYFLGYYLMYYMTRPCVSNAECE